MFSNFYSQAAFQAVAHGTFQGGMSAINGGNFWNGFAAGALSSIASSAFSWDGNGTAKGLGWGSIVRDSGAGMIAFGTIAGGVGAELSGGNFWQGAVTGLIVSGLNHLSQRMQGYEDASYDPTKVDKSNSSDIANGDVINMHNNGSALDLWAQQSTPPNGTVEVHAHGNNQGFGRMYKLDEIKSFLYAKSPTWKTMVDYGKKITLKLFACNTGSGSNSIAKQISMAFKNVTVVAPTAYWRVSYTNFFFFKQLDYGSVVSPGRWKNFKD